MRSAGRFGIFALGVSLLAACASPPPPPAPVAAPPPPPQTVVIPPRPEPPAGAMEFMAIPPRDENGARQTINVGISENQAIWNLRSALNVAALNCTDNQYDGLISNYGEFIKHHSRDLKKVYDALGRELGGANGRDSYITKVYNYFALPPTIEKFCNAAYGVSQEAAATDRGQLAEFSTRTLGTLEQVFQDFYNAYEQYRIELAAWDARYGAAAGLGPANNAPVALNATYRQAATNQAEDLPAN